jgi:chromosome segregation ATPase
MQTEYREDMDSLKKQIEDITAELELQKTQIAELEGELFEARVERDDYRHRLQQEQEERKNVLAEKDDLINGITNSRSWKLSAPLRGIRELGIQRKRECAKILDSLLR